MKGDEFLDDNIFSRGGNFFGHINFIRISFTCNPPQVQKLSALAIRVIKLLNGFGDLGIYVLTIYRPT